MAALNLDPNPLIIAAQMGIFIGAVVVVKKLMVEPYLRVKDKRDGLTVGSTDHAKTLVAENEKISADIQGQLQDAFQYAKKVKESALDSAESKSRTILADAKTHIEAESTKLEQELRGNLSEETGKAKSFVDTLATEVYQKVVQ